MGHFSPPLLPVFSCTLGKQRSFKKCWTGLVDIGCDLLILAESNCLDKQDPPGVKSGHRYDQATLSGGVGLGRRGLNTGWSSAVGLSRGPAASWAGRAEPWFTGALNGPWESAVMDSLWLCTLALCISVFLGLCLYFFLIHSPSLTQCSTRKNTNFFRSQKWLFLSASPRDSDASLLAPPSSSSFSSSSGLVGTSCLKPVRPSALFTRIRRGRLKRAEVRPGSRGACESHQKGTRGAT